MRSQFLFSLLLLVGCQANIEKAESAAARYAAENYPGYEVVNNKCEKFDSDSDGRTRCNLSLKSPDGSIVTPSIECPSNHLPQLAEDCQAPKGVAG